MIGYLPSGRVIYYVSNSKTACKPVLELGDGAELQLITNLKANLDKIGLKNYLKNPLFVSRSQS